MLNVTNTDNLMGIVIHGDLYDLDALHTALQAVNDLYYDNLTKFHKSTDELQRLELDREYFLSLNYDIRHAYMAHRNYELTRNYSEALADMQTMYAEKSSDYKKYGSLYRKTKYGNLQFNTEIIYPMALYYLYAINDYINDLFEDSFLDNLTVDYKRKFRDYHRKQYDLYQDLGILLQFYGLLQKALTEAISPLKANHLFTYINEAVHINRDTLYTEALCSYYAVTGSAASMQIKKAMITAMAYELFDSAEAIQNKHSRQCEKDYLSALKKINDTCETPFPIHYEFVTKLNSYIDKLPDGFYEKDFRRFLKQEYNDQETYPDIFETDPWPKGLE